MPKVMRGARRLEGLYGASSLELVTGTLESLGLNAKRLRARELYSRDLDCQNLGSYRMLELLAEVASEYSAPTRRPRLLDIGCGLGGPGRYLADRFGASVVGIDLLPMRIDVARELTRRTQLSRRISYRVANATRLPFARASFSQVWMLDVSLHIRAKRLLFSEIARVLEPKGLLVMHDQLAPIPDAMRPLAQRAPLIAPSLPQLTSHVEAAGLRVLEWRETTPRVVEYFENMKAKLQAAAPPASENPGSQWWRSILDGYLETLTRLDGRTGLLVARRLTPQARRARSGTRSARV